MKTIYFAAIALASMLAADANAQETFSYTPPFQRFGNYAPTMYANSGRPSARSAYQYQTMRPVIAAPMAGGYVVSPTYALPGTFRPYPRVTTSYYRTQAYYQGQAPMVAAPGAYGYDYQLRPPADWYNGYWGW